MVGLLKYEQRLSKKGELLGSYNLNNAQDPEKFKFRQAKCRAFGKMQKGYVSVIGIVTLE